MRGHEAPSLQHPPVSRRTAIQAGAGRGWLDQVKAFFHGGGQAHQAGKVGTGTPSAATNKGTLGGREHFVEDGNHGR